MFDNIVRVYDKSGRLLAVFDGKAEALNEEQERNQMVAPTVHRETNGESTLTFQMLVKSEKWQTIKNPENIYVLNDHEYTALNDGAYEYSGDGNAQIVTVKLVETWYLLDKSYAQAYNCSIYCYAKARFQEYTTDGAVFRISASECSSPGNAISSALAWSQVKNWVTQDKNGNNILYSIIKSDEFKPTSWSNAPSGVFFSQFVVNGNTATVTIRPTTKTTKRVSLEYSGSNKFNLGELPSPSSVDKVYVNTTTKEETDESVKYVTTTKGTSAYHYAGGSITLNYNPAENETINSVILEYDYSDMGKISAGATCTFAYGAEVVDEHTFCILPKADTKYKLTVNGVEYNDNDVRDSRGVIMPRGSAGYSMWAVLKTTGWKLGICDLIANGYDASIDYGCFNLECDMQNVLYIVQYIQELYGGILDWDSKNKILNYRAENSEDYQAYEDGYNKWTGYEFRIGKNMTNQPRLTWDNEIITKGYVLGYNNLNIKKVNGGKSYVENYSYTDRVYEGYLEQPLIYDTRDDGGMNQLKYWAEKEIAKKCKPRIKITASVTDIRTVNGYEHEVFDLNNIARVYYSDSENGEEKYEEKRITLWEYNAFAMWDCTVELGDKTQNLVEIFRLIYNTAVENSPKTNASGQIPSDEIVMEFPNFGEDIDFEFGGGGSSGFGGGIGGFGSSSLSDYISLIARKTTDHTDAISGLILEANELYAQAELFSQFQSVTENMVSETYAGLKTYADAESSRVELVAKGYYDEYKEFKDGEYANFVTETNAGFQAQETQNGAFTRQFSELNETVIGLDGDIKEQVKSLAEFKTEVTRDYAKTEALAAYQKQTEEKFSRSEARITQVADELKAQIEIEANHYSQTNEKIVETNAKITEVADDWEAKLKLEATYREDGISKATADIKVWARGEFAGISLESEVQKYNSTLDISQGRIVLHSYGPSSSYLSVSPSEVTLYSSGPLNLNGNVIYIKGHATSWQTADVITDVTLNTTKTIHYLGYTD